MSAQPKVLVTSAAGRTGTVATIELLRRGFPVRAFVKRDDARAAQLRQAGAEIFVGDLFDFRDVERALVGVHRAYHCPPFAPNLLHGATVFALAAEQAELEVVVLMSGWNPHPSHPSMLTREHWLANHLYRWMPSVGVIHLNPGLFAFTYLLGLPAIVHLGKLMLPFGDGLNAPPSNEDIGHVAAELVANPDTRIGRSFRPTGPEAITPQQAADTLGRVLGRNVTYQHTSVKMFAKAAAALGSPTFEITNVRHYAAELAGGTFAIGAPSGHVEELCGRPSEDFETIARRYVANPELITPGLSAGSRLGAIALLARIARTRIPDLDTWDHDHSIHQLTNPRLAHDNPAWVEAAEHRQLYLLPAAVTTSAPPGSDPADELTSRRLTPTPRPR